MKPQIILLALALAEMVPAGVRAQTAAPVAPVLAGRVGRASSLDIMRAAIPKRRARTLDLRASPDLNNQFRLTLRAFDALNLANNPNGIPAGCLFESDCGPWDTLYNHYKWQDSPPEFSGYPDMTHGYPNAGAALIEPTIMNGMVYVGCDNAVTVFGLS